MARLAVSRFPAGGLAGAGPPLLLVVGVLAAPLMLVARDPHWQGALVVAAGLAAVSLIAARDARTLHVPNGMVLAGAIVVLTAAFVGGPAPGLQALAGGGAALGTMAILVAASRGAMGWGDAKAGAVCGMVVGLTGVAPMLLATCLLGGAVSAAGLATGIRGRKDAIAFTPFLLAGVLVTLAGFPVYAVE